MIRKRSARCIATFVAVLGLAFPAGAEAGMQAVEYTRGVSYWYLPTKTPDVFRLYQVDVMAVEDLSTGAVDAHALVVTDRCTLEDDDIMYCGDGRRERESSKVELEVSDDLSSGKATIRLNGRPHVIRFDAGDGSAGRGVFDRRRVCSDTEVKFVAGRTANMSRAHGNLLGKQLKGPYTNGWDHAWLERGHGTWCGDFAAN
jgi:hypothetical protein